MEEIIGRAKGLKSVAWPDQTLQTKIEDCISTTRHILAGVLKGSCIWPLLDRTYVNDMPRPFLDLTYVNDMPITPEARLVLFADDTMFFTQHKNAIKTVIQLQHHLNLVSKFFPISTNTTRINFAVFNIIVHGRSTESRSMF